MELVNEIGNSFQYIGFSFKKTGSGCYYTANKQTLEFLNHS